MARNISCLGVGAVNASFKPNSSLTQDDVGKSVTMTANGEVGLGSDQDVLVGRLVYLDDATAPSVCTVQIGGVMELTYGGTPAINDSLVVDGAGSVVTAPVMSVGVANKGRGVVLDVGASKLLVNV